ncbi:MAG: ABC transporter ATP-binding protein/permease [Lachnospiraceae bacterium]|nr:ABC transporter ATP-binding protein/permease [Lachnospiraceae bacterium]
MKSKVKTLSFFLKGSKRFFALGIVFVFVQVIFDMVNPKVMGYTVDYIVGDTEGMPGIVLQFVDRLGGRDYVLSRLWLIAIIIIILGILGAVSRYLFRLFNSLGGENLARRMRNTLFEHILKLPYKWHDINKTGDIIQRCTSDVDMIRNFIQEQLVNLFRMVAMIIFALYFMFRINVLLSLCACFFILVVVIYSLIFHGKIGAKFEKVDEEEGRLSAVAQENLAGVRVVRAFGREMYERNRFETKNEVYINHWIGMMSLLAKFWTISDFVKHMQTVAILALGSYFTIIGKITAGEFVSFIAYNMLIIQPIMELGRVISEMSKSGVSIDRLRYIIESEAEQDAPDAVDFPGYGDIEIKNLKFAYDKTTVLDDVNMTIHKGETIGILGGTGSGKSTLMLLLDSLYELSGGSISINGVDISRIKKSELRKNIGFVLQEPYLFSRSLKDNIKIANDEASDEELDRAVETASLKHSISKFKDGFDTYVGEKGVTLSGGQKQRAAIAQMLIRNPEIMIFDDSLSAVDAKTDAAIRKGLKEASKDATVIIISHKITTIMSADNIYVFDGGKVVESGRHDELIMNNGIYSRIYDLQRNAQEEE